MGAWYEKQFAKHGVKYARALNFQRRSCCDDKDWLAQLEHADGVFITGGNQLRLTTIMGGTPAAQILHDRFYAGMPVAGTSAGAAVMSAHMIAGGEEGPTPRAGMVTMAPGFGLTRDIIIDQHFRQRDRLGRLLTALSYNPALLGLGVDEDTAAFISPDDEIDVMGTSAVTVIDTSDVRVLLHACRRAARHHHADRHSYAPAGGRCRVQPPHPQGTRQERRHPATHDPSRMKITA